MNTTPDRLVTLDQAAAVLGVSRRTIERRLAKSELNGKRDGKTWLVELPKLLPAENDTLRARVVELSDKVGQLTAEREQLSRSLSEAQDERHRLREQLIQVTNEREELSQQARRLDSEAAVLRAQLEAVTGERDYLRQAHAASLTLSTRLLPERTESNRPWWRVWR